MNEMIKEFISVASNFVENEAEIIQCLKILSITEDLSVFETSNFETAEFFTLLYELLNHRSLLPELYWSVVEVLSIAVRNHRACAALAQTYNFIHPLTALLDANEITHEKKLVVLNIIQELSYGVVIQWQEVQLPRLIRLLLDITMGSDTELVPVALSVMVNILHNNKPAIYTLLGFIDVKTFLRTILNLKREDSETSVQVCKLVMIFDHLSGSVPDSEILLFVRVSFIRMNKAFKAGNTFLMRHILDFFREAKDSEHGRNVLLTYKSYEEETNRLLKNFEVQEVPNNWECVRWLVEFLQHLTDLQVVSVVPLFPRMASLVIPWLAVKGVAPHALCLLASLLHHSLNSDQTVYQAVCNCMEVNLKILVNMLHEGCKAKTCSTEEQNIVTSLLYLLGELVEKSDLSTVISNSIDKEELKNLLTPVITQKNQNVNNIFQQPVIGLYVEVLTFVSKLSMDDKDWLFLYSDLLQKKQIQKALAFALYSGSYEVKKKVLFLAGTTSFSKTCLTVLSKCLTDLNHLFSCDEVTSRSENSTIYPHLQFDNVQCITKMQSEGLDQLMEKLDHLLKNNKIEEIKLAEIIKMYNYKLIEMRRGEQALQSSLVAAESHCAALRQRVARLSAETTRLHQLLYTDQEALDCVQCDLKETRQQLSTAQGDARISHVKFKQLKQDVHSKNMILKDYCDEISKLKRTIEEQTLKCNNLEDEIAKRTIHQLEQEKQLQNSESKNSALQSSNSQLEEKLRMLEKEFSDQKRLISSQQNQLLELERMRKIIFDITGGKKTSS